MSSLVVQLLDLDKQVTKGRRGREKKLGENLGGGGRSTTKRQEMRNKVIIFNAGRLAPMLSSSHKKN